MKKLAILNILFLFGTVKSEEMCKATTSNHEDIDMKEQKSNGFVLSKKTELAGIDINVEGSNIFFNIQNENNIVMQGKMGVKIPPIYGQPEQPEKCLDGQDLCLRWPGIAEMAVQQDDLCFQVSWMVNDLKSVEDCIDIGDQHWFGGPEELVQHFPMEKDNIRSRVPYLPGDMLQDANKFFGGVAEPFWINSLGGGLVVEQEQPLFYSWNQENDGQLCLSVEHSPPYVLQSKTIHFSYTMCAAQDAKAMFQYAAGRFWTLPTGTPDRRMMTHPIWSTWAQYKTEINESVVVNFAQDIVENGFDNSQLEIDDDWETCYGDAKFDPVKFPDPARMISNVKDMGFRVTLWIHPFINQECESFKTAAFPPNMYFVRDPKSKYITNDGTFGGGGMFGDFEGTAYLPGSTLWWQGFAAGYVDFTNDLASQWWRDRLELLRSEVGIDSFKFDAGESNWLPSSIILDPKYPESSWPAAFSTAYVSAVAQFGNMIEVRTGRKSQHLPIFVRMLDKFSSWGYENGLKSMVTTLLQFGIVGYPFVLPDMIGGNGYGNIPSRELYIRWLQVNAFMPAVQISFVPWQYDQEVVDHALKMTQLHAQYAPAIISFANQALIDGTPINRPIWWLDPTDQEALAVDDEFLLGDNLLVAPVMEEGAVSRDIYLPKGQWQDLGHPSDEVISGPVWLRDYDAPLFVLPYFIRI